MKTSDRSTFPCLQHLRCLRLAFGVVHTACRNTRASSSMGRCARLSTLTRSDAPRDRLARRTSQARANRARVVPCLWRGVIRAPARAGRSATTGADSRALVERGVIACHALGGAVSKRRRRRAEIPRIEATAWLGRIMTTLEGAFHPAAAACCEMLNLRKPGVVVVRMSRVSVCKRRLALGMQSILGGVVGSII